MTTRVLIVDDEPHIRRILATYLTADGFEVLEAGTGADAYTLATSRKLPVDLVLLDVGLPDQDGIEVLRKLRANSDLSIILVTARAEEVDKLIGLAVGADDYITKPFSPREVVARVKTVLRRAQAATQPKSGNSAVLRFANLTIDTARREIEADGKPVTLSALEFDILVALAGSPGRVYSRAQILEHVWGYDFFGDERIVDVHIRSIRKQLGDDATAPRIIGTVRGVGYKLLLEPLP